MTAGAAWVIAGLLGCAAEMAAPGVFLLPIGLAACGTGLVVEWLGLGGAWQVALFVSLTGVLVAGAWRVRGRGPRVDAVNAPGAGLIGRSCRAVAFEGGEGRVALGDGTWRARMADGSTPAAGAVLEVVGLEGTVLVVRGRGG
jgi:membrane protein implicated in regulation of membrane protease activity